MKVVLDEMLPAAIAGLLSGHDVATAKAAGYTGLSNGDLLRRAVADGFAVLVGAYADFEARVATRRNLTGGSKQDQVRRYILDHAPAVFRLRDVRSALPGISDPTIKRVLADLRRDGAIELVDGQASGRLAAWRRRAHGATQ